MTAESDRSDRDDAREYARILWRRRWYIVAVTVVVLGVVLLLTFTASATYTTSATVLVKPIPASGSTTTAPLQQPNMETEQALVAQSREIAEQVRKSVGAGITVDQLQKNVSAQVVPNTELLVISYRDASPTRAARTAQAFASAYVQFRIADATAQISAAEGPIDARISELQQRANRLQHQVAAAGGARRQGLQAQIASLLTQLAPLNQQLLDVRSNYEVASHSATIVGGARVPTDASSPDVTRNVALGVAVGLLLGVALALLLERVDDRVRDPGELRERLDVPVLASIPERRDDGSSLEILNEPESETSESYRMLADTLSAAATRDGLRKIVVTSAVNGTAKSAIASNLAVALSELGTPVALVSADRRRSRVHDFFGLENEGGLAEARARPQDVSRVARDAGIPNLRVVVSGMQNGDGVRRMNREQMVLLSDSLLRTGSDLVVFDAPPILEAADSAIVARAGDGVVLVVENDDTVPDVRDATSMIRENGVRVLGAVLVDIARRKKRRRRRRERREGPASPAAADSSTDTSDDAATTSDAGAA